MSKPPNAHPIGRSLWRIAMDSYLRNYRGMIGLGFIALMMAIAFFSPLIANRQPIFAIYQGKWHFPAVVDVIHNVPLMKYVIQKTPPFSQVTFDAKTALSENDFALWPMIPYGPTETSPYTLRPPSTAHWFGTDQNGRDLAARMVYGTIVSLQVGFVSMGIAAMIGVLLGSLAGYYGGWTDIVISRVIEIIQCFPTFFLILAILAWLEPSIVNVMMVIGLTSWTSIARYTRGELIRLQSSDYILGARALGCNHARIILVHLLPNAMAPVLVTITFGIAYAILAEAGLSWLGFGVQQPSPSWGNILRDAYDQLKSASFMVYPPCIAIFLAVLSYNLVGDALRDAIDPRLSQD
ncbi:MAG: ABC transporter permease subunit [bacterium]|nr:ABC transporter permease subunit [bacterium]